MNIPDYKKTSFHGMMFFVVAPEMGKLTHIFCLDEVNSVNNFKAHRYHSNRLRSRQIQVKGRGKSLNSGERILEYEKLITQTSFEDWMGSELFTLKWWILVFMLVIPWFAWYTLVDKKKIIEILVFGLLVSILFLTLDELGNQLNLWFYLVKIVPIFPRLIPLNYTIVPVSYMLIYQYFPKWKHYITVNIIVSVIFSFIIEPLMILGRMFILIEWKHFYTLILFMFIATFSKLLTQLINKTEKKEFNKFKLKKGLFK